MEAKTCAVCKTPLNQPKRGPMPTYCSARCRTTASRIRKASGPVVQIVPGAKPKRLRKPGVDDLSTLILAAIGLEQSLRFASTHADFRYRPMFTRLADSLYSALEAEGLVQHREVGGSHGG